MKRRLEGDPELILQGVASGSTVASFSVSRSGIVAWRPGKAALSQWTTFDRTGKLVGTTGPPGLDTSLNLSPDESHLLTGRWLMESEKPGRLSISSDRRSIGFSDALHLLGLSEGVLSERPLSGGDAPIKLADIPGAFGNDQDISPDGKIALLSLTTPICIRCDWTASPPERVPQLAIRAGDSIVNARFSPDVHWIVYRTYPSPGIFVQPFPGPGLRKQISTSGSFPEWRREGKEIVYFDQGQIWSIGVESTGLPAAFPVPLTALFRVNQPTGVVARARPLAITHDGSRIYFPQPVEQPDNNMIHVMSGWLKP